MCRNYLFSFEMFDEIFVEIIVSGFDDFAFFDDNFQLFDYYFSVEILVYRGVTFGNVFINFRSFVVIKISRIVPRIWSCCKETFVVRLRG